MSALELKIPPLAVTLIAGTAMWCLDRVMPGPAIASRWSVPIGTLLGAAGAVFCLLGIAGFRRRKTTVDPFRPHNSTALVVGGIYRYSRNPMYVGFGLFLAAWGVYLQSFAALTILPGYVWFLQRFQILPEERALRNLFGAEYREYRRRVRRWL